MTDAAQLRTYTFIVNAKAACERDLGRHQQAIATLTLITGRLGTSPERGYRRLAITAHHNIALIHTLMGDPDGAHHIWDTLLTDRQSDLTEAEISLFRAQLATKSQPPRSRSERLLRRTP